MQTLLKKHDKHSIGLIGHTVINYPSAGVCREAIKIMVEEGVDLIELQIPFSEPVADGPLFMAANHQAIAAGVTVQQCFEFMQEMSQRYPIPFVFMTYANIAYKKGYENFVKAAVAVGAKGAIIPDLSPDNAKDYYAICKENGFATIEVIPPNTSAERIGKLARASQGFVYAVARAGVTGAKTELSKPLVTFINRIRQHTDLPIAVGFGISSAADIEFLKPHADYAIIGSHALRILQDKGIAGLREFWRQIKQATGVANIRNATIFEQYSSKCKM